MNETRSLIRGSLIWKRPGADLLLLLSMSDFAMPRFLRLMMVCFVTTGLLLGGCSGRTPRARYEIALIPKGTTHEFWKSIRAGAEAAAAEHGDVEIIWQGPGREDDRQEQQNIVQRRVAEKVDAIILAPTDRQTLVAPVKAALEKDIPVVIIDSGLETDETIKGHKKYLGYIATNNYDGGAKAAERMAQIYGGKAATVLMLPYQAGSQSTELREKGFAEKIKEYKNLKLIVASEEAGATVDTAQKASERVLANNPNVDGIFTPNESSTVGMLQALRSLKKAGKITLVGFDGSEILINALKSGEIAGLVLQDPYDMGYQATRRAIQYLQGISPENPVLNTNLQVVTPENVNEPNIRKMYEPSGS